jgi:3-oxoacyl-[acyl-carrier protein] reductase
MELGLRDKVVLVVGASAGIGAATARLLHAEGARLVLVGRRESVLSELAASLAGGGDSVLAIPADASVPGALDEVVRQAVRKYGTVHHLAVIAAPMGARTTFQALSDSDWEFYFHSGLMIAVQACRAALPEMLKHGSSAAVLTAAYSIHAHKPQLIAYTTLKSAVAALSKNLAKTYGPQGLRVNCVAPGVIEKTAVERRALAERYGVPESRARYEFVRREFNMQVALERAGRHEEFADVIAYLLSERASYVTGSLLNVDGGTDF